MTSSYKYSLLNTKEATYYLEVSSFKFKKLIREGQLTPQALIVRSGKEVTLLLAEYKYKMRQQ